ncbi:hypothetical protein PENTCL1PPCAC_5720 [Pristionchus entomophagus]|uniref:Uncharacterized protein n=1 Tax=Pristionchus entomophagus TaxID=358040 RepID=A0AAV5SLY5_9BILA|nr:hypothetical protein PENTCL1PPCAC_5720 [Pristionchus entomophagus]
MIILAVLAALVRSVGCNLMDDTERYDAIDLAFAIGPHQLVDSTINELCSIYPSLYPSSEKDLITFKKEFSEFIADSQQMKEEVLMGSSSKYRVLPGRITELRKFANEEFQKLSQEEKRFVQDSSGLIMYKMLIQLPLEIATSQKKNFKKRKLSKDQIKQEIADREYTVFHSWFANDVNLNDIPGWRDRLGGDNFDEL